MDGLVLSASSSLPGTKTGIRLFLYSNSEIFRKCRANSIGDNILSVAKKKGIRRARMPLSASAGLDAGHAVFGCKDAVLRAVGIDDVVADHEGYAIDLDFLLLVDIRPLVKAHAKFHMAFTAAADLGFINPKHGILTTFFFQKFLELGGDFSGNGNVQHCVSFLSVENYLVRELLRSAGSYAGQAIFSGGDAIFGAVPVYDFVGDDEGHACHLGFLLLVGIRALIKTHPEFQMTFSAASDFCFVDSKNGVRIAFLIQDFLELGGNLRRNGNF